MPRGQVYNLTDPRNGTRRRDRLKEDREYTIWSATLVSTWTNHGQNGMGKGGLSGSQTRLPARWCRNTGRKGYEETL
jgi:hypothetical protein